MLLGRALASIPAWSAHPPPTVHSEWVSFMFAHGVLLQAKLGRSAPESAAVGSGVGAGVERAREAATGDGDDSGSESQVRCVSA